MPVSHATCVAAVEQNEPRVQSTSSAEEPSTQYEPAAHGVGDVERAGQ